MPQRDVNVGAAVGLHARPAAAIAERAAMFEDEILISFPGSTDLDAEPADAASALMIMSLGAQNGDTVRVSSVNSTAVDVIANLIQHQK